MPLAIVWKKPGILSQDFLGQIKKELGFAGPLRQGIGHTGTLDPFAEGLLCVGIEEGTKLLAPLTGLPKTYEVTMALGLSSNSFDTTGQIEQKRTIEELRASLEKIDLEAFLASKVGRSSQFPPPQSAARVDGKRAYEWAHAGIEKTPAAREISVLNVKHDSLVEAELGGHQVCLWSFEVTVSAGTYIRAFARDWGRELTGEAALLSRLVRTQIGPFKMQKREGLEWLGINEMTELFDFEQLDGAAAEALRLHGRWVPLTQQGTKTASAPLKPCLILNSEKAAIAWAKPGNRSLGRVFQSDPFDTRVPNH